MIPQTGSTNRSRDRKQGAGADTSGEEKKETLVILAHRGMVKSYRTLERFLETAERELEEWGILVLEECLMPVEMQPAAYICAGWKRAITAL